MKDWTPTEITLFIFVCSVSAVMLALAIMLIIEGIKEES